MSEELEKGGKNLPSTSAQTNVSKRLDRHQRYRPNAPGSGSRVPRWRAFYVTNERNLLRKCLYEQSHGKIRGRREEKKKSQFALGHQLAADGLAKPI